MNITIQQKIIHDGVKKLYKDIQTPETIFTKEWMKNTMKQTVALLYKLFPAKNIGAITVTWCDENDKKPSEYGECVYYFQICFHDKYTKMPWLICRFYRRNPIVRMYLWEK